LKKESKALKKTIFAYQVMTKLPNFASHALDHASSNPGSPMSAVSAGMIVQYHVSLSIVLGLTFDLFQSFATVPLRLVGVIFGERLISANQIFIFTF
jgi:hypothetical protein